MTLEKKVTVDQIEIIQNGLVQIRTKTAIFDDGEEINSTFHRRVVAPGNDYSAENAQVQAICAAVHTGEVIAAYKETQTKEQL
jgi:hypothetical protein